MTLTSTDDGDPERAGTDGRSRLEKAKSFGRSQHTWASALLVGVVLVTAYFTFVPAKERVQSKLLPPDTPPAEYLYLDSDRVSAYLGQIEGGLPAQAKRTLLESSGTDAAIKGGLVAELKGSTKRETTIEETVSPAATDRFYALLRNLRSGRRMGPGLHGPWLHDLDAAAAAWSRDGVVNAQLQDVYEGDFVRLKNAHLFLPSFAALAPRTRNAPLYSGDTFTLRPPPAHIGNAARALREVDRYLKQLGADPGLPFVIPTLARDGTRLSALRFLVPARYSALLDNARLLTGNLTVVGKVIFIDPRNAGRPECDRETPVPCTYIDRQTLTTYAPPLQNASGVVRDLVDVGQTRVAAQVRRRVQLKPPLVVVLPVAIYQ